MSTALHPNDHGPNDDTILAAFVHDVLALTADVLQQLTNIHYQSLDISEYKTMVEQVLFWLGDHPSLEHLEKLNTSLLGVVASCTQDPAMPGNPQRPRNNRLTHLRSFILEAGHSQSWWYECQHTLSQLGPNNADKRRCVLGMLDGSIECTSEAFGKEWQALDQTCQHILELICSAYHLKEQHGLSGVSPDLIGVGSEYS